MSYFDPNTGMVSGLRSGLPSSIAATSVKSSVPSAGWEAAAAVHDHGTTLLDRFAAAYGSGLLSSANTVECLVQSTKSEGRSSEEHHLWRLVHALISDCLDAPGYQPNAIGVGRLPPDRMWYASHYALIQNFLQRSTFLRRVNVVLKWLESRYGEASDITATTRRLGASNSEHEQILLRRLVVHCLRSGQHPVALQLAEAARDAELCCVLAASELQKSHESWFGRTKEVDLFGEYGCPEYPKHATNTHRLVHVSYLYEDSIRDVNEDGSPVSIVRQYDGLIAAILSGNEEVLLHHCEPQGVLHSDRAVPLWQHELWSLLRGCLVSAVSKMLVDAGSSIGSMKYLQRLDIKCRSVEGGAGHDGVALWVPAFAEATFKSIKQLLQRPLTSSSLEEQLEVRTILQLLSSETPHGNTTGDYLINNIETFVFHDTANRKAPFAPSAARAVSHFLLCFDLASSERLIAVQLQGAALTKCLAAHLQSLERADWLGTLPWIVGMVRRIHSPQARAELYAAYVFALRVGTLQRGATLQSVEDQENALLAKFREADHVSVVHDAILVELNKYAASHAEHLLTQSAYAESLLWASMRADTESKARVVLRQAAKLSVDMWRSSELDALSQVSQIVHKHLLPKVSSSSSLEASDTDQTAFWKNVLTVREAQAAQLTAAADAQSASEQATAFRLSQTEELSRQRVLHAAREALRKAPAVVAAQNQLGASVSTEIASCCAWVVRCYAECVTLALSLPWVTIPKCHSLIQEIFFLVEVFDRETGLMERAALPRDDADQLFTAVRVARARFGWRRTREAAAAALAQ